MRGLSIRSRLIIGMVAMVAAGLVLANVTGILLLRSYLQDRVDEQVAGFGAVGQRPPQGAIQTPTEPCANPQDPRGLRSDFLLVVLNAEGDVECSLGPSLENAGPDLSQLINSETTAQLQTVPSLDGEERWRARSVTLPESDQRLVFAVSLAEADATVARLTTLSILITGGILVLTALAAAALARIGLRPLQEIEESADQIAHGDLSQRVPTYRPNTEIGRLAGALNGMLGQIERAFTARTESEDKLRRFVSDASHELRTPLAAIRGHAEMWQSGVSQDLDTLMGRIESESMRMGDLVDDLLLLAQLDQARPLAQQPVDLLTLATEAVIDAQALQPQRRITLDAHAGPAPPVVIGDESRLRQILANLVTNALVHTPTYSPILLSVGVLDGRVSVTVRDDGPGMPPEAVGKVFDRFYRVDSGRSRDQGGSGLGLAIVKSLTEAHAGTITCTSSVEGGSTFRVDFPLAP
jgi:two-component system, OmpR family, sensor kinase